MCPRSLRSVPFCVSIPSIGRGSLPKSLRSATYLAGVHRWGAFPSRRRRGQYLTPGHSSSSWLATPMVLGSSRQTASSHMVLFESASRHILGGRECAYAERLYEALDFESDGEYGNESVAFSFRQGLHRAGPRMSSVAEEQRSCGRKHSRTARGDDNRTRPEETPAATRDRANGGASHRAILLCFLLGKIRARACGVVHKSTVHRELARRHSCRRSP